MQLHTELQRTARKDKRPSCMNNAKIQRKTEGEKIRDLTKIRTVKGNFHPKMGTIKDRNGKSLTEVEEIKKRWKEYTEERNKKILMTRITTMVWSLTLSQEFWSVKQVGLRKHCCQ